MGNNRKEAGKSSNKVTTSADSNKEGGTNQAGEAAPNAGKQLKRANREHYFRFKNKKRGVRDDFSTQIPS